MSANKQCCCDDDAINCQATQYLDCGCGSFCCELPETHSDYVEGVKFGCWPQDPNASPDDENAPDCSGDLNWRPTVTFWAKYDASLSSRDSQCYGSYGTDCGRQYVDTSTCPDYIKPCRPAPNNNCCKTDITDCLAGMDDDWYTFSVQGDGDWERMPGSGSSCLYRCQVEQNISLPDPLCLPSLADCDDSRACNENPDTGLYGRMLDGGKVRVTFWARVYGIHSGFYTCDKGRPWVTIGLWTVETQRHDGTWQGSYGNSGNIMPGHSPTETEWTDQYAVYFYGKEETDGTKRYTWGCHCGGSTDCVEGDSITWDEASRTGGAWHDDRPYWIAYDERGHSVETWDQQAPWDSDWQCMHLDATGAECTICSEDRHDEDWSGCAGHWTDYCECDECHRCCCRDCIDKWCNTCPYNFSETGADPNYGWAGADPLCHQRIGCDYPPDSNPECWPHTPPEGQLCPYPHLIACDCGADEAPGYGHYLDCPDNYHWHDIPTYDFRRPIAEFCSNAYTTYKPCGDNCPLVGSVTAWLAIAGFDCATI